MVELMKATGRQANKAGSPDEHWRELIQKQAESGQSGHVFCCERGWTDQSFYFWRKRLRLSGKETPVRFALVATEGRNEPPGSPLELDLGSGQRLRIPRGVDAATLPTVLAVLRERA